MITARHPQITENELGEESQVKAEKDGHCSERCQTFGIEPAGHFGPPEMDAAQISHHRAPDHNIVKMSDDEISIMDMNINRQRREKKPGEPADGKKSNEAQSVKHRRLKGDRTFVKRGRPIEDFDSGRDRHEHAEQREDHAGINGLAAYKHVMTPHEKAQYRNRQAGKGDKAIAEDPFARKTSDQFAHHSHTGQNHDVDRWVRIEPK